MSGRVLVAGVGNIFLGDDGFGSAVARRLAGASLPEGVRVADGLATSRLFDSHGMQPDLVLGVLDMLGSEAMRILVVCCEPASTSYGMELSEPVAAAVDEAARIVTDLVTAAGQPPAAVTRRGEQ